MSNETFTGKLVRLVAADLENDPKLIAQWEQDSEYQRLFNSEAVFRFNPTQIQKFFEESIGSMHFFFIERLEDGRKIGMIDLSGFNWTAGNAWVGIGIGERDQWGKGYGTDAMRIVLRYAFTELNLRRVSLSVFDVNQRGVSSYLKAGFRQEALIPGGLLKAGKRCDILYMGILRREWEDLQKNQLQ
jgi:RimJ/RimL family protein N-acetyltransferase